MNSAIMDIIGILLMAGAIILIAIGFFWKE
jgi:hypothetical protein|nr:hypothetical protein AUSP0056_00024 [uncultured phage]